VVITAAAGAAWSNSARPAAADIADAPPT